MNRFIGHLSTVMRHRREVMKNCFRVGLIWRGLTHDLSKFSPSEFIPGVRYYQGDRSPQAREREIMGYSAAWLHHKGRNKHHFEYWTETNIGVKSCVKMPAVYFAEMICDRIAASKIYMKEKYTDASPLCYFLDRTDVEGMNEETARDLRYFLELLERSGEEEMFTQLKAFVKKEKKIEKIERKKNRQRK